MYEVFNANTGETVGYVETVDEAWEATCSGSLDFWPASRPTGSCSHSWTGICVDCVIGFRKKGINNVLLSHYVS